MKKLAIALVLVAMTVSPVFACPPPGAAAYDGPGIGTGPVTPDGGTTPSGDGTPTPVNTTDIPTAVITG